MKWLVTPSVNLCQTPFEEETKMALQTKETEGQVQTRTVHLMPCINDNDDEDSDGIEKDSIHAIQGMEEVESWPLDEVLGELVRTGFISEEECIFHEEL